MTTQTIAPPTMTEEKPSATEWAMGCDKCSAGLRGNTAIPKSFGGLWEVRYMQAKAGLIAFCSCRAGVAYRNYVHRREGYLLAEPGQELYLANLRKKITEAA